nr:hypothetical protein [uncultured Hyphomonas sp.]
MAKKCFVISPIGEEGSDTRKRADQVLKHILTPAAESLGYETVRADTIDKPGLITSQVIQHIVSDDLVIADLTERNPNVFYELAIRHAIRKPLVQVIQKGEKIPFDVAGLRTISIDHTDLDAAANAKTEIARQIETLEKEPEELETPISVSLDLQALRQSENPDDRSIAAILGDIADIKVSLSKLQSGPTNESVAEMLKQMEYMLHRFRDRPMYSSSKYYERKLDQIYRTELDFDGRDDNSSIRIAMIASMFERRIPWLYEIGMEAYRQMTYGSKVKARKALDHFRTALSTSLSQDFRHSDPQFDRGIYVILDRAQDMLLQYSDVADESS